MFCISYEEEFSLRTTQGQIRLQDYRKHSRLVLVFTIAQLASLLTEVKIATAVMVTTLNIRHYSTYGEESAETVNMIDRRPRIRGKL